MADVKPEDLVSTVPPEAPPAPPEPVAVADPAVAAPAAPETPALASDEPTLLEQVVTKTEDAPKPEDAPKAEEPAPEAPKPDAPKPEEVKPDPAKPAEVAKPVEAPKVEPEKVPLPVIDYKYELPETLKLDDATKGEFHSALDAYRGDQANPQPLIDLYNKQMQAHDAHLRQEQQRVFADTRKAWRTEVMADEQMGGAGHDTAMQAVARMRDQFASDHPAGSPEYLKDIEAFNGMLRVTGVGDHPINLKMWHRVARFFDAPSPITSEIQPAPNNGRAPRNRREVLYDNSPSMKKN